VQIFAQQPQGLFGIGISERRHLEKSDLILHGEEGWPAFVYVAGHAAAQAAYDRLCQIQWSMAPLMGDELSLEAAKSECLDDFEISVHLADGSPLPTPLPRLELHEPSSLWVRGQYGDFVGDCAPEPVQAVFEYRDAPAP